MTSPVDTFLEHYGTKGMKWGVRRKLQSIPTIAGRQSYLENKDAKWIAKVNTNPKLGKMARISSRDAKKQIKQLNREYKDLGYNVKKNGLHQTRYDSEVANILQQSMERASHKVHGRSGTGLLQVTVHRHPDGSVSAFIGQRDNLKIRNQIKKINKHDARVKNEAYEAKKTALGHADEEIFDYSEFEGFEFKLTVDEDGFFEDIQLPFDIELEQSDIVENFLAHYGVKGMRWGVRRKSGGSESSPSSSSSPRPAWQSAPVKKSLPPEVASRRVKGKRQKVLSEDAQQMRDIRLKVKREGIQSLTNKDLEVINRRMELQQKYNKNFPKKKSPLGVATDLLIDAVLTDAGEKQILEFLAPRSPNAAVAARNAILLNRAVRNKK